jgi:hypothetical protein
LKRSVQFHFMNIYCILIVGLQLWALGAAKSKAETVPQGGSMTSQEVDKVKDEELVVLKALIMLVYSRQSLQPSQTSLCQVASAAQPGTGPPKVSQSSESLPGPASCPVVWDENSQAS